jgi:peptide/nickel transport system permease protein
VSRFVIIRLLTGLLTVWLVSVTVFLGVTALPGDAATAILGQDATPSAVGALRHQLGLDKPLPTRYWNWAWQMLEGNLGHSLTNGVAVSTLIGNRIVNTLTLAAATLLLLLPSALVLGAVSGLHRYRAFDSVASTFTLFVVAIPEFVVGSLFALVFGVLWAVLPAVSLFNPLDRPWQHPAVLVLPVATLLATSLAWSTRLVRGRVIEVMDRPFVEMARLKGTPERVVVRQHVMPNAFPPLLQAFALIIGWLLGGVVVVETVFNYPGVGAGLVSAVAARDAPTVMALSVLLAGAYVVINALADIATILATPRARTSL